MNRWTCLNLSFLIPFALIQISASLIPYHYKVLVFYRSVVFELTVPLLILSHVLAIATLTLPSRIRNRWSTVIIVWFSFLALLIGTFAFISISSITKSSNYGTFRFGLGYFILLWSNLVPFLICIAIIGLIAFRRRSNLQRWTLVVFWMAIFCTTAWLWLEAGTTSYKTIHQVNIQDRQISLMDRGDFGGVHYLIYNCNSFGFFCKSFDFYDSYTIGSFSYWRDPVTRKVYVTQGNKNVLLTD
jgi:hypothetical protein